MSQTSAYFCHTKLQAEAFIQKVESLDLFIEYKKEISENLKNHAIWDGFGSKLVKMGLVSNDDVFYLIFLRANEKNRTQKDVTTESIRAFLNQFFPEVNTQDYENEFGSFSNQKNKKGVEEEKINEAYVTLAKETWLLYTFGEKTVMEKVGVTGHQEQKRIHYLKERPVKFDRRNEKSCRIRIKNRDVITNDTHKDNLYDGKCNFSTKIKDDKMLYYLETSLMDSDDKNDRQLRLSLCFGELKLIRNKLEVVIGGNFGEFGIGIFSGLRDGGAYFTGAALLVKKQVMKGLVEPVKGEEVVVDKYYDPATIWDKEEARIHKSLLKNPNPPLKAAIRMLLERRNRAFIKLPKGLEKHTLTELKDHLMQQRVYERSQWEPKDLHLSRTQIFISIPLFYETSKFENNRKMMDAMIEILTNEDGSFKIRKKAIEYGVSKGVVNKPKNAPYDKAIFETNFDHISQSKFFILILPDITFPYHNNHEIRLSTAFLELGFAWGQRRKIIIFCSSEMESHLPKGIIAYKDQTIKIVNGDLENENDLIAMVEANKRYLLDFMK